MPEPVTIETMPLSDFGERSLKRLRELLIEGKVNIVGLNWFETAMVADAYYDFTGLKATDAIRINHLIQAGLRADAFTAQEIALCEVVLLRDNAASIYWDTVIASKMPLSYEALDKLILRGRTDTVLHYRGSELAEEQVYLALVDLKGFTTLETVTANVDLVRTVDIVSRPKGLLDTGMTPSAAMWYSRAAMWYSRSWGDVNWWVSYIRTTIEGVRNALNVGTDMPDEWVIQAGFKHPEIVQCFLEKN